MKNLTTKILACGAILAGLCQANADVELRLSTDSGATWTNIVDNGPGDSNPSVGLISYSGTLDGFTVGAETGVDVTQNPNNPYLDLGTVNFSSQPATLIAELSETGYNPFNNQTFIARPVGETAGSVYFNAYRDPNNILYGENQTLFALGPFTGDFVSTNNVFTVAAGGNAPFSLTLQTTVIHTGAGDTETDSALTALPVPQCNCSVTFNSPSSVTNCAGDTIADVVATQDCGAGPTPVTVTVTGAVTNGTCPMIITRTNAAVDGCGTTHTFVQKITVNCAPICTITPSVTTTTVGTSNLTASVADAGAGATYAWSVLNGTITAGQNTTKITWTAGTDTNSPITIVIKITSATGCQSVCSTSVKLNPNPPHTSLTSGDTATIGFWHNKNGQGLILGASNSPALGNWLASNYPCLFGTLAGQPNSVVASTYLGYFGVKGQKTYAQVMSGAFAVYFTTSGLGGGAGPKGFGFNVSPGGTGNKLFNVGTVGTTIGLQNNTSYTVSDILTAANAKCPWSSAVFDALNTIFDGINSTGDIN